MIDFSNYGLEKKKYRSSINWGKSLTESTYYERFCSRRYDVDKNKEELIRRAYTATRDLIIILNFPFSVYIQITQDNQNSVDDKGKCIYGDRRICLPTKILDKESLEERVKINTVCGFGLHEAAHLMYSDWKVYSKYYNNLIKRDKEYSKAEIEYLKALINLIEDERVEDKILSERPGLSEFIELAKTENSSKVFTCSSTDGERFLTNLFFLIRFPDMVDKDFVDKYSEIYKKISDILNPLPQTTKDSCLVAEKIFTIIKEDVSTEFKLSTPLLERVTSGFSTSYLELKYGQDDDSLLGLRGGEVSRAILDNDMISKLLVGSAEKGESDKCYFEKMVGNKREYLKRLNRVKQYIPRLRKIISGSDKNYDFNIPSCRSGTIDTTKLAEAYQGVPQVYMRQGHVRTNKTTLCVLIDESGSMGGTKAALARDAAILLNEAFGTLPGIDLYIYGHSADINQIGEVNMTVYREGDKYKSKYALSEVTDRVQNRDGEAIIESAMRVRKHTLAKCIMIVISDGEPCAIGYGGESAMMDVKKSVEKVEKMNFDVIQVSIDKVYGVERMFTKYINLIDGLSELPKKLSEIIKKVVIADKKTIIT